MDLYSYLEADVSEIIFEVQEAPEGGYTARALGYSIFTEADTFDELREMARDAVRAHFDDGATERSLAIRLQVLS